ncbi:MAG: ABC transporter permease, partial [Ardenticatenaceae bacterium]
QSLWRVRLSLFLNTLRFNWGLFVRTKIGLIGLVIIAFYFLLALAHPILINTVWSPGTYDPVAGFGFDEPRHPAPPSLSHPLGTDPIGRDVLSQLMWSTRSEFMLGVVAALVTVSVGTIVGAAAAYFGGVIDALLMRLADITIMTPILSLLIVISGFFEVSLVHLALIIGLVAGFGSTGVVLKSQALTIKVKPYVEAAKAAGGGPFYIIFVHIIPNLMPLSFFYMMFTVTSAIFAEATLSYLGLLDIPMSWGIMIHTTQTSGYLLQITSAWWIIFPVSLSITLLSASFYLVGRALDEIVNPRLRRS